MRGLVFLMLSLGALAVGVPPGDDRAASPGHAVYRRALAGSAWVLAAGQGKGSGFVVDAGKRWLVTCYHVVGENETCEVVFVWNKDGAPVGPRREYLANLPELTRRGIAVQGKVIRRSKDKDLALIEVPSLPPGVTALPLAATSAEPGRRVWAVGNRYDVDTLFALAAGRVRLLRRSREGYFSGGRHLAKGATLLLADVPINEGDSGGALIDERGDVVGMSAAVAWEAHGGGLFLDVSEVRAFLGVDVSTSTPGASAYRVGLRSTALVRYAGGGRSAGVVVDKQRGLVLTTADAVAKEKAVEVNFAVAQPGGVAVEAKWYEANQELLRRKAYAATGVVLAVDARRNLALVEVDRLPTDASEVRWATASARPGDELHLISHPARLGVLWAYAAAVVRQRGDVVLGRADDGAAPAVLIAQASLSDGEGGGPALDARGECVGIVSGKVGPQQQIVYVLEAREARAFLDEVRPSAAPRTADDCVRRAGLFVAARALTRAKAEYDRALTFDERSAAALAGRAWLWCLLNRPDDALRDADRALRIDAKSPARQARAAAWLAKGDAAKARAECDVALKDDPKCALCFALRALARLDAGDVDGAATDADEGIWFDAKLALASLARGRIFAARDQAARAHDEFARAVALDPHLGEAHRRRADLLWARGDVDGAAIAYDRALALGEDVAALFGRGRARLAQKKYDEGLTDLDQTVRRRPDFADAYVSRGGEKLRRNWVGKGAADLLEAIGRRPALLTAALLELERHAADLPAADEAAAYAVVLKGIAPSLGEALRARVEAGLVAAAGQPDEAKKAAALRQLVGVARARSAER